jgi:hypothetical protein
MTEEELDRLIDTFVIRHAEYGNWKFNYEYPGFFTFYNGESRVYLTPDWTAEGFVDIQLTSSPALRPGIPCF